ncbi:MAG: pantoate--beta-alanine ligase [Paludibacter sp.]|nr:pantoate--beta-alanine ligase [Paludibacter sp.]
MKIVKHADELKKEIFGAKNTGEKIGFVPTMGALHAGHKLLVERAIAENDFCIVSIFVNPTQFNNKTDLEKYPRNLDVDILLLEKTGCDLVFVPNIEDMYALEEMNIPFQFDFGGLDQVMEGKFRPGHFNGVVQIVSKLFNLVQPDKAYFGEKDFQQLSIIHRMVKIMNYKVDIIDCPIVREPSGLAMSSRNERLSTEERKKASEISKVLFESRNFVNSFTPDELSQWVIGEVNAVKGLKVEYFEIVDIESLQIMRTWSKPTVGCITVFCGAVRLIDNIRYIIN